MTKQPQNKHTRWKMVFQWVAIGVGVIVFMVTLFLILLFSMSWIDMMHQSAQMDQSTATSQQVQSK